MDRVNGNQIEKTTHIDELTGLLNLTGILNQLRLKDDYVISGDTVIIYLNVMNFKTFNQRYGFSGGNEFLKGLAEEIKGIFSDEFSARTGGDQFIILAKSNDKNQILDKLAQLREAAHKYEKGMQMRIKAGIYQANGEETDPVVLVDRAKIACDDIIRVYDKDTNIYDEDLSKKNELRQYVIENFEQAFKNEYFKVYYQKEVRALTGKVCGYEALARWIDPVYGMISPAIFVEVLESAHLVHKLDIYIISQVCRDLRKYIDYGLAYEPVSVNLSRLDFELCDILEEINRCREKYNIPVNLLNIEITESAVASGEKFLGDEIKRFRDDGYQVWMDDFGAGYSSLNNLMIYNFDVLKIDMNFLRTFETNKRSKVILATIINMAKELGIHTLAEGVETKEQFEFLRRIGCEKMQGYLFGKPVPVESFDKTVDYSFDKCEDLRYKQYFRKIGDINFLGTTPLRNKNMEVYNNLPIAIVELDDIAGVNYIYCNNAYVLFLNVIGINGLVDAQNRVLNKEIPEVKKLTEMLKRAEKAENQRAEVDLISNGNVVNMKGRFIVREGGRAAFVVFAHNNSPSRDAGSMAENIRVATAHVLSQYFRVDLFDENGTVENVFLNGEQVAVTDELNDSVLACQLYANMYILPQDRERFLKYYDMTTVRERVEQTNTDYVVEYFHSAISGDNGRMQMYMILPFYYNNGWKFISLCRYADEISDDTIKT